MIWAIHSVPLSQHYSVQLHRLLTAGAAFDDLIFVSMDWRPEKRLNCRRGVSAYIFSPLFSSSPVFFESLFGRIASYHCY